MAYNEDLCERIENILHEKKVAYDTKNMFGGVCFLMNDKMLCGIIEDELMARIGPEKYDWALEQTGVREMDFNGRAMKGYVFVEPEAIDTNKKLGDWLQLCIDYNPEAKASKKKK